MNILILGGGGFIGNHLVKRLRRQGHRVRGVDLKYPEFTETIANDFVIGDLRDPYICKHIVDQKFDEVYQLAADMGGAGFVFTGKNDADIMHNSALINLNMLEACYKRNCKRIFYSSSACIYPEYNQKDPDNPVCSEDSAYPAMPDSCLSSDTEVMTKNGFKFIGDITLNDKIATLSPTGYLEYHCPVDKQTLNYNGKIINFKSKFYDCLVTPEHKVATSKNRGGNLEKIKAKDFIAIEKVTKGYFKRNCKWQGSDNREFVDIFPVKFEKNTNKQDRGNRIKSGMKFKIDDYIKFAGWFVTEGCCGFYRGKDYEIQIRQCKKGNLREIVSLCQKMGLTIQKSSYENNRVIINSKALFNHLKDFGHGAKNKRFPSWILNLPEDKLKILFDTMLLGDGTLSQSKIAYCTSSPILRDQFVEICLKIGYACTILTKPPKGNINETYHINVSKYRTIHKVTDENIIYLDYKGVVYDLTVPNHIFYIRRNGRHLWTGNSYGWEKLFSERLYLAFAKNYGMEVRIARLHNIYGPEGTWQGGREKAPAALCRKVATAILKNKPSIEIWGDGLQTRSFLYIEDCLDAMIKLMRSEFQGPVNIGSEEMVSINQLAKMITDINGVISGIDHTDGPQGVRGRNSDNRLIEEKLQWRPKYSLKEGLIPTYIWIEKQVKTC